VTVSCDAPRELFTSWSAYRLKLFLRIDMMRPPEDAERLGPV